jgi:hypothetical protein
MNGQNRNTLVSKLTHDSEGRDVFWSVSFSEHLLEEFLSAPDIFVLDRCHNVNSSDKSNSDGNSYGLSDPTTGRPIGQSTSIPLVFLKNFPVTVDFIYSTPLDTEEEIISNIYLVTGISGSNHITVHCPKPHIIDWEEVSIERSIENEVAEYIGVGTVDQIKVTPILFGDSPIGFAHYEIPTALLNETKLLRLTANFIRNPSIIAAFLNHSVVGETEYTIGQGVGENVSKRLIRFQMPEGKGIYHFMFSYTTRPANRKAWMSSGKHNNADVSSIAKRSDEDAEMKQFVIFAPSDCIQFTCSVNDNAQTGIILMTLGNGTQIRWLPSPVVGNIAPPTAS